MTRPRFLNTPGARITADGPDLTMAEMRGAVAAARGETDAVYDYTPPGVATGAELDRRLTRGLCVWCAVELGKDAYHDLYCTQDCQMRWMQARNGDPGYARPERVRVPEPDPAIGADGPPAELGLPQTSPDRVREAGLPTGPGERNLHIALGLAPSAPLPLGWDYQINRAGTGDRLPAYGLTEPAGPLPVVVGPAQARASGHQELCVGVSVVAGYDALAEAEAPRLPTGPWPVRTIDTMIRQGYVLASALAGRTEPRHRPCPLPTVRECARCEQWGTPQVVTAEWPAVHVDDHPDGSRATWHGHGTESKLCCPACMLPYPGPLMVPMVMGTAPWWNLTVVAEAGGQRIVAHQTVTDEAAVWSPEPELVARALWDAAYRKAEQLILPWVCMLPRCEYDAQTWVTAGAAVGWRGWLWEPGDGEPLHLGMCYPHGANLRAEAYRSPGLMGRMALSIREASSARWSVR